MKQIVADSSSIISISQSCLINILARFLKKTNLEILIPKSVEFESVERPISIHRFELNAVRIMNVLQSEFDNSVPHSKEVDAITKKILLSSNNLFHLKGKSLRIIQEGEAEALALCYVKNIPFLLVDERTTRLLVEDPMQLKAFIERRYDRKFEINVSELKKIEPYFKNLKIIRSVDILALAFEENSFSPDLPQSKQALQAALFGAKYSGCAVAAQEIFDFVGKIKN